MNLKMSLRISIVTKQLVLFSSLLHHLLQPTCGSIELGNIGVDATNRNRLVVGEFVKDTLGDVKPGGANVDGEDVGDIDRATGLNAVQSGEGPIDDWTELSRDFQEEARPQMEIAHMMVSEI